MIKAIHVQEVAKTMTKDQTANNGFCWIDKYNRPFYFAALV